MRSIGDRPRVLRVGVGVSESNSVLVRVDDTGSGIDPELRDRIFEPFVTTKPGGMGLGLSICRSIVEAHGGRVSVSAGNPHGSSFQLALPPWKPSEA
jgi:signal transduction histidine kinase